MRLLRIALLAVLFCVSGIVLFSQTSPNLENGFKPYGSYDGGNIDTVNLLNGNLMITIPAPVHYPQRGGKLDQTYSFYLTSKNWTVQCTPSPDSPTGDTCGWVPSLEATCITPQDWRGNTTFQICAVPSGASFTRSSDLVLKRIMTNNYTLNGPVLYYASNYSLVTPDMAVHSLKPLTGADAANEANTWETTDHSGYRVLKTSTDANGIMNAYVIVDRLGNGYQGSFPSSDDCSIPPTSPFPFPVPPSHFMPEADQTTNSIFNCGQVSGVPSAVDTNENFLDTMGRNVTAIVPAPTADYTDCVSPLPISAASVSQFPELNGTLVPVKMCYSDVALQTNFSQANVLQLQSIGAIMDHPNSLRLIHTIVLPDHTKWTFSYDSYGEVLHMGLPLGGSIDYEWGEIGFVCGSELVSRAVTKRTVHDNNGHSFITQYSWGALTNGTITNIVTDALSNDTVHIFAGNCALYETQTQFYQGRKNAGGHLVKQVDTTYSTGTDPGDVFATDIQTTVYPSGNVSKIHRDPDAGGLNLPRVGEVTRELVYDWGQNSPGALLRETDTVYQWQNNSSYLSAHMLDLPASTVIISPTAAANIKSNCPLTPVTTANCMAETDYSYDEYSDPSYLQTYIGAISHGALMPYLRGNLTTVSKWLNTGGPVATHTKWYDTGMPYQQIDAMGHITQFSYDNAYAGAYVTQTCSPQTGSVTHCVTGTYDFNTGMLTSLTNENATTPASGTTQGDAAHTSNYTYDTIMPRLTLAQAPPDPSNSGARAQNAFTYPPNPPTFPYAVTRQKSITNGITDSSTTTFDGLGRAYKSQHVLPGGTSEVDTTPDANGRIATVTNPFFSTSDPTYGSTTNLYDALDRVYQTTKQDGSASKVAYSVQTTIAVNGDCTQTTDEAGNQRGSCSDALGRLVEVDEPNPGISINVNYKATLLTDGNFVLENAAGTGVWSTGTFGTNATSIFMQDDGNLVLYVFKWQAGTYAAPSPGPFPAQGCSIGSYLMVNQRLNAYQCIVSPHGQYLLYMGSDGNFYIYDVAHNVGTWGPGTYGHPGAYAIMQGDGNLCVYTATNTYLWCSGTGGTNADRLNMEDDGRIIIYKSAWNSGTGGQPYGSALAHPGCDVGNSGLGQTGILGSGTCLVSPNGRFDLLMQGDGNLVIYDRSVTPNAVLWSTGTATSAADPGYAMRTLYSYDALGNLLRVEQHGDTTDSTKWRIRTFTYDSLSRLLTASNPESGTITYSYDADGELLQKTSPAPNQTRTATQTVSYCYDALHRVTAKGYGAQTCPLATPVVTYAYDSGTNAIGKLTSLTDQAGTASYTYDILGRLSAETRTLTGANNAAISKNLSYEYNLDGSLYKLHYPSGNVVTYAAGAAGLTLSAIDSGNNINYVTSATYGPDSALTGFVSGYSTTFAGITNKFLYTSRLQPCRMIASTSGTLPTLCSDTAHGNLLDLGYDFHLGNGTSGADNGNVFGITNYKDTTRNQTFTYDVLNRLVSARNAGTDCTATVLGGNKKFWGNAYAYDAWGNLIGKSLLQTPAPPACAGENLSLTADSHNWIHATGGSDYLYDAAGNMTFNATPPTQNYTYDQENRLTGAAGYTYTYDADGNRVRKSSSSTTGTLYWYMTPGIVGESDLSGNLTDEYVFFDGERVARKSMNGVFYYFSDHLKTASVITDSAGVIKAESDYYPWGGELQLVANDTNHYKFTGKERDGETQLDYFGARYYSNGLGRWVSADWSPTPIPVPYADFGDPQTLNLYGYVRGLPTVKADLDGHDWPTLSQVKEAIEEFADANPAAVRSTAGGLVLSAATGSAVGPAIVIGGPSAVGMGAAILGPKLQPADSEGCLCPDNTMYMWSGQESQAQSQNQGQTPPLGQGRGADEEKSQSDDAKDKARTNGGIVKDNPAKGPGTVPPDQRDPKRNWNKSERQQKLDQQGGKCAHCGKDRTLDQTHAHHIKRHANGGRTNDPNHVQVCKDDCHKELHR